MGSRGGGSLLPTTVAYNVKRDGSFYFDRDRYDRIYVSVYDLGGTYKAYRGTFTVPEYESEWKKYTQTLEADDGSTTEFIYYVQDEGYSLRLDGIKADAFLNGNSIFIAYPKQR